MNAIQLQIRTDINYLAGSWKTPKIYPVNGDISKEKSFDKKPALLSFLKPEESDAGKNGGKLQTWVVELFLVYSKLPEGADPANKSSDFDTQSSEMIEILEKLHSGLTKKYIGSVKNPIAHSRGYESKSAISYLDTYFEFGANKYMAVRATFKMLVPVPACFDCTDYVDGTFESVNVPPYDVTPVGGLNGAKGDIIYWNDVTNNWVRLRAGEEEQVLAIVDGIPSWEDATGGGGGLTCETIGDCPAIQNIVTSVDTVVDDLAQEILDRAAADDALQDAIDAEATSRINADNDLQTSIDTEINDRQSADADLQTNIDNVTLEDVRAMSNEILGDIDANGNTVTNLSTPVNASDAVPKSYVDGLIDTTIKVLEGYDPTITSLYPITWGGNAIRKGDSFKFTVAGSVNGIPVTVGDFAIAQINAPGQTDANWMIGQTNVDQATESAQGIAKISTQAQVEDENSTNNTNIVTPQKLWLGLAHFVTIAWTWTAKQIFSLAPRFSSVSANHVLTVDGSKDLTSEAKATAFNKDFGTGTSNVPEIGSTLGNSLPLQTTAAGKLQTVTVAAFKTLLALVRGDVGLGNVPNVDTTPSSFGVSLDAQGAVIGTGSSGSVTIPYAGTINNWYVSGDVSGSIVIDVKRSGASIVGAGNKPTVSSSTSANAAVSGWTSVAVSAGDIISFNVDSASTMTKATLVIKMTRT
jgi:hypothetical protein